ncbi:MAG: amino acid ABC transporter permease [Anaerolineaceae bacterium]|nr:amino acid ABC transporter permease [Anaerolineaceae bacterium]
MTTSQPSNPSDIPEAKVRINYDEPPTKPPPLLSTGVLAWIRENLLSSPFDATLTILGGFSIIFVFVGLLNWIISQGDWFAITFNFEQYMYGRFTTTEVWRLGLFVLIVAFVAGNTIAAYFRRISPVFLLMLAIIVLPPLILPAIVNATIPLPDSYVVAGNENIVSGTVTEDPIETVAFTARSGETITFRYADEASHSDEALADIAGFVDNASNALRTAATNRLANIARFIELDEDVQIDTEAVENGEAGLFIPPQRATILREYQSLLYTPDEDQLARIDEIEQLLADNQALVEAIATDEEMQAALPPTAPFTLEQVNEPDAFGAPVTVRISDFTDGGVLRVELYNNHQQINAQRINVDESGTVDVEISAEDVAESGSYTVYATVDDIPKAYLTLSFSDDPVVVTPLTEEEHLALVTERGVLLQPESVVSAYDLNTLPVAISISDRDGNPLSEGTQTLEPGGESVSFTIPEDGWYLLQKEIASDSEGAALLAVHGIYPLFERSTGAQRMTDGYEESAPIPRDANNEDYPFYRLTENKYRGDRPLGDYLRVYLSPFFTKTMFRDGSSGGISLQIGIIALVLTAAAGYFTARALDRTSPQQAPQRNSRRISTQLLLSIPFIMFLAVIGADLLSLSLLGAWVAYVIMCYFVGLRVGDVISGLQLLSVSLILLAVATVALYFAPELIYGSTNTIPQIVATMFGTTASSRLPITFAVLMALPGLIAVWYGSAQQSHLTHSAIMQRIYMATGIAIALFVIPVIYSATTDINRSDPNSFINIFVHTDPRRWGGLLLAAFITVYGIILAFPLGIALALGRRSELPAIKLISTLIIETVRGTPFIVVLFAGVLLIPFANPAFAEIPDIYSALVATIVFIAAYLAENVRGGLQSIPPGQDEAARALGLSGWQITMFITLPQALRAVIPALVGQFIGLFKDTSLLAIVGLIDLTGVTNQVVVAQEFIGTRKENLLFITILYFVISYIMSWVSRRIEESGSGSARRI